MNTNVLNQPLENSVSAEPSAVVAAAPAPSVEPEESVAPAPPVLGYAGPPDPWDEATWLHEDVAYVEMNYG